MSNRRRGSFTASAGVSAISTPVDLLYARQRMLLRGLPGRADLERKTCWPLAFAMSAELDACRTALQGDELSSLTILKARARGRRVTGDRRPARFDVSLGEHASLVFLDLEGDWVMGGPEAHIPDAAGQMYSRLERFDVDAPYICRPSLCYASGEHPTFVQIEVTTHCNLHCGYCTNRLLADKEHTPLVRLVRMLDGIEFGHITEVEITGLGESLLHPDLPAIVGEIRRRGRVRDIGIITNGTVATIERCRPLLDAGLTRITVSFDSLDPVRFAQSRAGARLDVVVANVLRLAAFRRTSGLRFGLNLTAVLQGDVYREAERLLEFSAEHALDRPRLTYLDPRNVSVSLYPPELRSAERLTDASVATWAKRRWSELTGASAPPESESTTGHELPWDNPRLRDDLDVCSWVLDSAYVGGDGFCLPCCEQITDIPRPRIASVLDRPLSQLWNDDLLYAYRLPLTMGLIPPNCVGCDHAPANGEPVADWQERYGALLRLEDEDGFDRDFGTETTDVEEPIAAGISSEVFRNTAIYWPTLPRTFRKIMATIEIGHEDFVFVDFGSGKGRTLLLASEFPFKRIVGVELLAHLHQIAHRNIEIYRSPTQRCTDIQVVLADARIYPLPGENSVFYFFDPLGRELLATVLGAIEASLKACPRRIFLIYVRLRPENLDLFKFLTPITSADGDSPTLSPEFGWTIFTNTDDPRP